MGKKHKHKHKHPATEAPGAPFAERPATYFNYLISQGKAASSASTYTRWASQWTDYQSMLKVLAKHSGPDAAAGTLNPLRTAANHWCDWMNLPRPTTKYRCQKVRGFKGIMVTREEALAYLHGCPRTLARLCALLVLETGLRGDSLVAVLPGDIERALRSSYLEVRAKGGVLVQLRLTPKARKLLKKIRKRGGFPPSTAALRQQWRDTRADYAGARLDAHRWTMHTFRHAFATELRRRGAKTEAIGGILGHTNPASTARYIHLVDVDSAIRLIE